MTLPGPSGGGRGAALVIAGLIWLFAILPRFMTPAGRAFNPVLITRIGLLALPILCAPVAFGWYVSTPAALNAWFAVAWGVVWLGCLASTALLPCPACGGPFGRVGIQLEIRSSRCAHCGVDARADEISPS